jgi:opacity protein-like surface antigen
MKKSIWLLMFFIGFAILAQAQNINFRDGEFRFGLHFSPTFSNLGSSDRLLERAGTNIGTKIGVTGEKYFAPNYAVTAGIGFGFNQGGTVQSNYPLGRYFFKSTLSSPTLDTIKSPVKLHYRLTYVEVPFSLRFRGGTGEDARLKYFGEAPIITLGFLSKALGDIRNTATNQNSEDEEIREAINGLSLAWGVGGGIEYEIATNTTLVAGVYYQHQFTDMTADNARVFDTRRSAWRNEDAKTSIRMLSLRVGLYF